MGLSKKRRFFNDEQNGTLDIKLYNIRECMCY